MSLRLNVPAIEEKPALPAETHPRRIQEMIASLPLSNHRATARLLLDELERLNRQKFTVDIRLTALELYRPAIINTTHGLSRQYCNQPLPLQETARAQAGLAQQLLAELAIGYKQVILTEEDRLFTIGDNNQLALLLQRALDALGRLLQVHHLTYTKPSDGVWLELHQLYLHALQQSLQSLAIPEEHGESSINLSYKHALLLSMATPAHLTSIDTERVIDYLDRFADLAQLHPLITPEKPSGIFLVRLKSDSPPVPLAKNTGETDPRTDILLITIELARQVHQHITRLQPGARPTVPGLPDEAFADQRYRDMLQYLLTHWGNPPKRVFNRLQKNCPVQMCVGLPALHYFLAQASAAAPDPAHGAEIEVTLNFAASPIDNGGGAVYRSAYWMVLNESPGGLALSKPPTSQESLRIGELLGLKSDQAGPWGLAIVRWASNGNAGPLQIGAQMIAPSAQDVTIQVMDHPHVEPALLLPELPSLNQPATLIAARGIYKPARTLRLEENGQQSDIMLTRLVERANNFERFQFSRL